jgi:hypothetical protein
MQHPQIVIYEADGWLAAQVVELAREHSWLVRESRRPEACLALLHDCRPAVLLVKLDRKMIDEFQLIAAARERVPECPIAVFSDVKFEGAAQRASLAGLAYDIGVRYVMFPPLTKTLIEDVTAGLMTAAIARFQIPKGLAGNA